MKTTTPLRKVALSYGPLMRTSSDPKAGHYREVYCDPIGQRYEAATALEREGLTISHPTVGGDNRVLAIDPPSRDELPTEVTLRPLPLPENPTFGQRLQHAGLPASWESVIEKVSAKRDRFPCGAALGFGGSANLRIEVAFRAFEDHFVVFQNNSVICTFTLNFDQTIDIGQPLAVPA